MRGAQQDRRGGRRARDRRIAVVGVPKTIDNDIPFIDHSFGFQTAFAQGHRVDPGRARRGHALPDGVGLVQLMGRHSGFIACYAALANNDADYVLIPEVPFELDGDDGFLRAPARAGCATAGTRVVVVAEGAGQDYLSATRRHRRLGQPAARRLRRLPAAADHGRLRGGRPGGQPQVHRPELR